MVVPTLLLMMAMTFGMDGHNLGVYGPGTAHLTSLTLFC